MSGIYISGMKMPTEGELLSINIEPDGKVCISLDLDCKQAATAIPVPGHGRLVDADALIVKIINYSKYIQKDILEYNEYDMCAELITQLALAPTIIPADKEGNQDNA